MELNTEPNLVFLPNDASFQGVVTFLLSIQGFACAASLFNGNGEPEIPSREDDFLFDAPLSRRRLIVKPYDLTMSMVNNHWPSIVEFKTQAITPIISRQPPRWGVIERFLFGLSQSLVGNFFEEHRSEIDAHYGGLASWPPVWNFARVIRNAMSHAGKLTIKDKTSVSWKGLSYTSADTGREIINYDIYSGDFFYLIKEMEAALPPQTASGK